MKKGKEKIKDMLPVEIKVALLRAGIAQAGIARDNGVTVGHVNMVILGASVSHRIRTAISKATEKDLKEIWPSRYLYGGGPRKRGRPVGCGKKKKAA